MGNRALEINGDNAASGHADIHITVRGSDWYFTVTSVMGFFAVIFWALSLRRTRNQRLFYYLAAAICLVSGIGYFTEASNLGWTAIPVEWQRSSSKVSGTARQIFWVRYIDYFVTSPLILLTLSLSAAFPWPTILYTMFISWVMVVSFLVGALVQSTYKWGYFAFATVSYLFIAYTILFSAREHAAQLGGSIYRTYLSSGALIVFLWLLYPIAWGCSEGGNVIAPDSEAIFYGVIDLLAKPVFCALIVFGHQDLDIANLGIQVGRTTETPAPAAAHTNGHGFTSSARSRLGSLLRRKEKAMEAGEAGATNGQRTEGTGTGEAQRAPESTA